MNTLYLIGIVAGRGASGILAGLCMIHLYEHSRGNPRGPVYTAMTHKTAGLIFVVLGLLSVTGVYSILVDLLGLL